MADESPSPPVPRSTVTAHAGGPIEINSAVGEGVFKINGGEEPTTTRATPQLHVVIIRAVRDNRLIVHLNALSLLAELERKIESFRPGSNSEIAVFDDLKRRVEIFLAASEKGEETPVAESVISIADILRRIWEERRDDITSIGLLGTGLTFCAAAGALGVSETNILAVTALAGGQRVADALNAAANLVWGRKSKSDN